MSELNILVLDQSGECLSAAQNILGTLGFNIISSSGGAEAVEAMARCRPQLIICECGDHDNPLRWVELVDELDLPAQVIAVLKEPSFEQAMDWVAGGLYNVLSKPLDEVRFRRICLSALENCQTFEALAAFSSGLKILERSI